jgi:hypothetical protein
MKISRRSSPLAARRPTRRLTARQLTISIASVSVHLSLYPNIGDAQLTSACQPTMLVNMSWI